MDLSDSAVQAANALEDLATDADDTLISPYTSPQKEHLATEVRYGSGDYIDNSENNHLLANQICAFGAEKITEQTIEELQTPLQNVDLLKTEGEEPLGKCSTSETPIEIEAGDAVTEDTVNINDESEDGNELSNTVQNESELSSQSISLPTPEEEKEKIFAEMLASAGDTTPNEELTPTELISISKKMEEEFRTMFIEEQHKKKLSVEGPSYAASKNLLNGTHYADSTDITTQQSLKNSSASYKTSKPAKTSFTSRLPTSQSRTSRPNSARTTPNRSALSNRGFPSSPVRSVTKARCTPTTIRLTPRNTSSEVELRSPLQPATTPIQARFRRSSPAHTGITTTPLKAASTTLLPSPRTTTPVRRPLSTPRRPPSVQSSDSGGRCTMPDMRHVRSKIGSLENAKHTPGGGKVKIENKRLDYSSVGSKCGSLTNATYSPRGGKVKIESRKLDYRHVGSKCGSMANVTHTPGGGKVKVESKKLDYSKVSSKCGSRDNMKHTPRGGKVKIFHEKRSFENVAGRIGSLDNIKHTPGGGKVKIFHASVDTSKVQSKVGSKDNIGHTPKGGKVKVMTRTIDLSHVKSKCGSLDYASHVPGGGDVEIFNETPQFKETAKPKVGSLDNAAHVPGGGDIRIYDEKLRFREMASHRTDVGLNGLGSEGSSDLAMST